MKLFIFFLIGLVCTLISFDSADHLFSGRCKSSTGRSCSCSLVELYIALLFLIIIDSLRILFLSDIRYIIICCGIILTNVILLYHLYFYYDIQLDRYEFIFPIRCVYALCQLCQILVHCCFVLTPEPFRHGPDL